VLGTPFFNSEIIEDIAVSSGLFEVVLRQKRFFTNRFGKEIREDILNLQRLRTGNLITLASELGQSIALNALTGAFSRVPQKNRHDIETAIKSIYELSGTPVFNGFSYVNYQTRDSVMMVR
jgi:hypothetical protein